MAPQQFQQVAEETASAIRSLREAAESLTGLSRPAGGPIVPELFESRAECEAIAGERTKNREFAERATRDMPNPMPMATFICLPDTVDPRGPKGAAR